MQQLKIINSITSRESESLNKYLLEINKLPMVTSEQEATLADLIRLGDKDATDSLVKANLRFVVSVAKQYQFQGLSLPDLINEGNIGLIKATGSYDASRGFKFISYAVWWIRQKIIQAIANNSRIIRLPPNKVILKRRVQKMSSILEQQLERKASTEEIADELHMSLSDVSAYIAMNDRHISFDAPLTEEGETNMLDVFVDPDCISPDKNMQHDDSLRLDLSRILNKLTERQYKTICCFFGIGMENPMSLDAIGRELEVTPERVRQIKDKALSALRTTGNYKLLRSFIGTTN